MLRRSGLLILLLGLTLSASAQVILNEVLYDTRSGDSADSVYTELYGPSGTDLTGWSLVGINGNNGTEYRTIPLSGTIPEDGYFLIGNNTDMWPVDLNLNIGPNNGVDWQNAGSTNGDDCDGIQLKNASGTVVDHVCYGPCATAGNCTGEGGTNAPDPFPAAGVDKAIARVPDHQDTDNNGADWVISDSLTPGAPNSGGAPCEPVTASLLDIRENDDNVEPVLDGQFVVTRGIVNVDNGRFDTTGVNGFFFQDDDAGVNVFRPTLSAAVVAGDCVVVSGWVSSYRGLTEIVSSGAGTCVFRVEVVDHVDVPAPALITTQSDLESYEGMLVRLENVSIVNGNWPVEGQYGNLTVNDGNGTIGLTIDKFTDIDGTPAPTQPFTVIGILSQYDNTPPYTSYYQIVPRTVVDIVAAGAEDPAAAPLAQEFRLAGAYPNPFNPATTVRFEVGSARALTLTIYDLLGREVARELLTGLTPGTHSYTWSPTGAAGLYLVRLEGETLTQTAKLLYLK